MSDTKACIITGPTVRNGSISPVGDTPEEQT